MSQVLEALSYANEVKAARTRVLQPLRRGDLVIGEVDLDAPELQTMLVIDFLCALRYRASKKRTHFKPPATFRATKLFRRLGCSGGRRIGDLTARQKREMVRLAETVPAQRRTKR